MSLKFLLAKWRGLCLDDDDVVEGEERAQREAMGGIALRNALYCILCGHRGICGRHYLEVL